MQIRNHFRVLAGVCLFAFGSLLIAGCGVSEEQLAQLEAKKKDVKTLELKADGLKSERTRLENEIAQKNKKLEECNKVKQQTQANLDKIQK